MAILDTLFGGSSQAELLGGLLGEDKLNQLRSQATQTGLINAAIGYLAQPKNQRFGSALPYLARAFTAGQQGAQGVYDDALRNYQTQAQLTELKRKKEQEDAQKAYIEQYISTLPAEQQAVVRAFPGIGQKFAETQVIPPKDDFMTVGEGQQIINPRTGKVIATGSPKEPKPRQTREVDAGNKILIVDSVTGETVREIPKTANITSFEEYQLAARNPEFAKFLEQRDKSRATQINMPSEGERTAGFLTNRVQTALDQINRVVTKNPNASAPKLGAEAVKFLTGSDYLKTLTNPAERQQIENAQLDLLDAALTLGTGAAYTREQLENYRKSYFPQLGESQKAIKDKSERLDALLRSARIKAGRAAPADIGLPAGVTVEKVR
jgi:hypothetical protein